MKIHKLAFSAIVLLGLITTALSLGFYTIERNELLRTISDGLNQSLFHLEDNTRRALQNGRAEEIQAILDQATALNDAISEVSISRDQRVIEASSSRSLKGNIIGNDYLPLTQLRQGLIRHQLQYRDDFYYFEGAQKREAILLMRVDEGYVFGRLQQVALLYGLGIFLTLGLFSMAVFAAIRRTLVIPLEKLTAHAHTGLATRDSYFIEELSALERTLSDSFTLMSNQQHGLQAALDETRYLDGILRTVADINQLLITAKDVEELITKSVHRLAQHPGYRSCWIALNHNGNIEVQAFSATLAPYLSAGSVLGAASDNDANDPVAQAFNQSKTVVIDQLQQHRSGAPWRVCVATEDYGSFIALPLLPSVHEQPIGILGLYAQHATGFAAKEIAMLEELAGDIGFAIRAFGQRELLKHHLTTDPVTTLPNRVALADQLTTHANVMLAIINIDRFSDINEVYGNRIGDGVLAKYGRWLSRHIASYPELSLYKIGSDEYVLLFDKSDNPDWCRAFLEQLLDLTSKAAFVIDDIDIVLTVTIGMALASDQLLEHATAALKQAKLAHQSIAIYENTVSKKEQENNIAWYKLIKEAIEESRIIPYYQPIVDNTTRRVIKYEALMRLISKDGSIVSPAVFLGIAKKTKLYAQLTRMMIDKTIDTFKHNTLPVSINLSTEDLLNGELADYLEQVLNHHQIGKLIIFEILESEGIENYAEVSAFVDRFKSIGCRFAIDDFGSGYSNFDHLLKLNIDTLKIDGSLIKNLPHDRNTQIIVKHICDFASEMGISTVAEFVANETIYTMVREIGIDASQGYYFYEPAPAPVAD